LEETYALIPGVGTPVTFYTQQKRALNLVWALHRTGKLHKDTRVGVVGAGLAGVTAAVAAKALHCQVSLFEKEQNAFHEQYGNHTRYISPHISEWPSQSSLELHTDLPYLNWTADLCNLVIEEIKTQWDGMEGLKIRPDFGCDVKEIAVHDRKPHVVVELPYTFREYDIVILCAGFGNEWSTEGFRSPTYWRDDDLHQPYPRDTHILVSGTGDGGLIDAMRCVINGFDHQAVLQKIIMHENFAQVMPEIQEVEHKARAQNDPDAASGFLWKSYETLDLSKRMPQTFTDSIRRNVTVTLNGRRQTPLDRSASALNRVIVYCLLKSGSIAYVRGELTNISRDGDAAYVNFEHGDPFGPYQRVIVRHGPRGGFAGLISADALAKVQDEVRKAGSILFDPQWTGTTAFRPVVIKSSEYWQIAAKRAARFLPEFTKILQREIGEHTVFIQSASSGAVVYSVNLGSNIDPKEAFRPSTFARIAVEYRIQPAVPLPIRPPLARPRRILERLRPLVCGIAVQNGFEGGLKKKGKPGSAQILCFVRLSDGSRGFVCRATDLGVGRSIQKGNEMVQPVGISNSSDLIGEIRNFTILTAQKRTSVDAAICALEPNVDAVQCFLPSRNLPTLKKAASSDDMYSTLGKEVMIVGEDEVTTGTLTAVDFQNLAIQYPRSSYVFDGLFEIELPVERGDILESRGIVMTNDGVVLGATIASAESVELQTGRVVYGFRIQEALEIFDCTFLPFGP
jgi:hypothetical protein